MEMGKDNRSFQYRKEYGKLEAETQAEFSQDFSEICRVAVFAQNHFV